MEGMAMAAGANVKLGGHRGDGQTDGNGPHAQYIAKNPKHAENTLPSLRDAVAKGAVLLEIDAVQAADGNIVVTHSNQLDKHVLTADARSRLDTARPYVSQYRYAELQYFPVGPAGAEPMPLLQQVLELLMQPENRHVVLNIELKGRQGTDDQTPPQKGQASLVEAVLQAIEAASFAKERLIFSSFSAAALAEAKERAPEIARGMLFTAPRDRAAGTPVYTSPGLANDDSRYELPTAEAVKRLHTKLALHYLHPEVTTVTPELVEMAATLRSPSNQPLGLNIWSIAEPLPQERTAIIQEVVDLCAAQGIELGVFTNYLREMQAVLK